MKKIHPILTFVFFFLYSSILSQQFDNPNFLVKDADKIILSTIYFKDKTTEPPAYKQDSITKLNYPIHEDIQESITKTGSANLNKTEQQKVTVLLSHLKLGHALSYQYDIQLDFYKKNKIIQTITISSETKNLVLKKKGCQPIIDQNGQEIDPCIFKGIVSDDLKKCIVTILKSKKLWNKDQQFLEDDH